VRQPSDDRARYYRQLRASLHEVLLPELTSAQAVDTVGLLDRILVEFIVEEEAATALSAEYGARFAEVLEPDQGSPPVTPARFDELRGRAAEVVALTAASTVAEDRQRCHTLGAIERDFLEQVEARRGAVLADGPPEAPVPSADGGCSVSAEQLTAYFRAHLPDSPEVRVERLAVVPGGRSKETILVSLRGTTEFPHQVIVRKDRPVGLLQTRAADEFAVIKAVHDFGGIPVPEPFFVGQADDGLGQGTFLVMECVPGHKAGEFFPDLAAPTEHRADIGRHLAASLARLHALPLDRLAGTGLEVEPAAVTEDSVLAMVEGMVGRINELSGLPCVTVPLAHQWLREHVSDVVPSPRLALLQGDFGFHNTLVDGSRVTALVDWEGATIGPPAREMAAAYAPASALMDWPAFVAAYVEAGGPVEDTDRRAIDYYRVFLSLGGFMTSKSGGHLFRTGAKRDLLTAHSGLDSNFRCARNLARALADAMAAGGS
jgi:aminoglycoside phosphotransferase (APT) family kinase protein